MKRNRVAWLLGGVLLVLLWGNVSPVFSQRLSGSGEREPKCVGSGCDKAAGRTTPGRQSARTCRGASCMPAVQVQLALVGEKITHADGKARIQVGIKNLRASVTGLPADSPPLSYRFRMQRPGEADVVSSLVPIPEWTVLASFSTTGESLSPTGNSVTFSVTVTTRTPQGPIKQRAEIGPYLIVWDWSARDRFTRFIAPVMMHPRCLNCHVSGNSPTQGDDRHLHSPPVNRDTTVCTNCHGTINGTTPGSPPGRPGWRLPPATFSFVSKSANQLCRQLKDPSRTGGRSLEQLIEHVESSKFIMWAWSPGLTRTRAPRERWEFVHVGFIPWVRMGAACPEPEERSRQDLLR